MDANRNTASNELEEFSLKFISVPVHIFASQWSRNDEGRNRADTINKAAEHSVSPAGKKLWEKCDSSECSTWAPAIAACCVHPSSPLCCSSSPRGLCWMMLSKSRSGAALCRAQGMDTRGKDNVVDCWRSCVCLFLSKGEQEDGCKTVTEIFQKGLFTGKENILQWKLEAFCLQLKQVNYPRAEVFDSISEVMLHPGGLKSFTSIFLRDKISSTIVPYIYFKCRPMVLQPGFNKVLASLC